MRYILLFLIIFSLGVYAEDLKIEGRSDDVLFLGFEYKDLFKVTNLDHKTGEKDNITVYGKYNISNFKEEEFVLRELNYYKTSGTGLFKPREEGNYTICGYILDSSVNDNNSLNDGSCKEVKVIDTRSIKCNVSLWIYSNKNIYENEKVEFYNYISNSSFPFIIEYWIEDIFGYVAKKKYNTTVLSKKRWAPKVKVKEKAFLIKNKLHVLCNNSGVEEDSKLFVVKGKEDEIELSTYVKILDVSKLKENEVGDVKIEVVKGDTRKYAVTLGLGSEKSKIYVRDKGNFTFLVPVIPKKEGNFDLVLEGLGSKDKKKVEVEGLEKVEVKEIVKEVKVLEEIKENNLLTGKVIYESTDIKAGKLGVYMIIFALILIVIFLVFRKDL